ncbi:MAG: SCO family protein [Alphaproteobacteria bacterium]|uniref:SCO family protein n=1 Tax=Candidatus Nitrobium versatile TaxID=2884831 RepID=A0A953JF73_9BACT|nr:SCO family protein [Candidatus Nitrobium versatile]
MKKIAFTLFMACMLLQAAASGDFRHTAGNPGGQPGAGPGSEAAFEERTGYSLPLDAFLYDEEGRGAALREFLGTPAILVITYYQCSHICPQVFGGLADAVGKLKSEPGRDFRILSLSFDATDTPEYARSKKVNYIKAIGKPFPDGAWKFLTGRREDILRVTEAAGIRFKQVPHGYIHPEVLLFLSPEGKITKSLPVSRYQYGAGYPVTFSPVELEKALSEASRGEVQRGGKKTPFYCFHHEPDLQDAFAAFSRIAGGATLTVLGVLFLFLRAEEKRKRTNGRRE